VNVSSPIESQPQSHHEESIRNLAFQERFDILLEIRVGGVAKQLIWEIPDIERNT
jgi:hypothetical protein